MSFFYIRLCNAIFLSLQIVPYQFIANSEVNQSNSFAYLKGTCEHKNIGTIIGNKYGHSQTYAGHRQSDYQPANI